MMVPFQEHPVLSRVESEQVTDRRLGLPVVREARPLREHAVGLLAVHGVALTSTGRALVGEAMKLMPVFTTHSSKIGAAPFEIFRKQRNCKFA